LEFADLLEQFSLLRLNLFLVLPLLAACEQLTGSIEKLPLLLAHLDRVNRMISDDLLDHLVTVDRLHGDPGLEFGAVGRRLLIGGSPDEGRYRTSEVNDGTCRINRSN
jgi:hypothetical protein